jgi:poly-gamma-glutamate capsule biosynthesis protein CapA/YwtB (metallophosphatase superfamily)
MTEKKELTMLLVGDVFVVRDDPPSVFQHVKDLLRGADFTFGNLEGTVADGGTPLAKATGGTHFKSDARQITAITAGGFNAMNVANNHMMDFGHEALLETIEQLDRLGIAHCGGGRNFAEAHAPSIVEREGCRVAMLGYTCLSLNDWIAGPQSPGLAAVRAQTSYQPPKRFMEVPGTPPIIHSWVLEEDKAQLKIDIASARQKADIVLCTFHWGVSSGFVKLTEYQVELGHFAIDVGADLVFGHHPHVPQGVEAYKGKAIFYSLGNFTFANHNPKGGHELESLIVRCRIQDKKIKSVEYLPACSDNLINPHALDLVKGRYLIDIIKKRSMEFDTRFTESADSVVIAEAS